MTQYGVALFWVFILFTVAYFIGQFLRSVVAGTLSL